MFDLEKEAETWALAVHADRCRGAGSVAELKDHLHCEVERLRAEGMPEQQAFEAAVAKLGRASELATEHARNRSWFRSACGALMREERRAVSGGNTSVLLAHAILWAAVILATSLLMSGSTGSASHRLASIGVISAAWWSSDMLLRRVLRRNPGGPR